MLFMALTSEIEQEHRFRGFTDRKYMIRIDSKIKPKPSQRDLKKSRAISASLTGFQSGFGDVTDARNRAGAW